MKFPKPLDIYFMIMKYRSHRYTIEPQVSSVLVFRLKKERKRRKKHFHKFSNRFIRYPPIFCKFRSYDDSNVRVDSPYAFSSSSCFLFSRRHPLWRSRRADTKKFLTHISRYMLCVTYAASLENPCRLFFFSWFPLLIFFFLNNKRIDYLNFILTC